MARTLEGPTLGILLAAGIGALLVVACAEQDRAGTLERLPRGEVVGVPSGSPERQTLGEVVGVPSEVLAPPWLEARRQFQLATLDQFKVFHDFTFSNQVERSAIRFRNKVVIDAAKQYKSVHYDHGNGIAIADVDGDGLHDIYFVTQVGANELWRNLGDGKFENITDRAGVALAEPIKVTASFADIDNDGDADLYVTTIRSGNHLFENDGTGKFANISAQSGLDYKGHSSAGIFFDYDRDGLLDLFLANVGVYTHESLVTVTGDDAGVPGADPYQYYVGYEDAFFGHLKPQRTERSILYRNVGENRFVDVSEDARLVDAGWTGDASVIDGNSDGWPDLYVLNMQGQDEYYENVNGQYFVKKSRQVFPNTPWGAMGIKVFDFNNDGLLDIYLTDMHSDMSELVPADGILGGQLMEKLKAQMQFTPGYLRDGGASVYGNAFYRNEGGGRFTEISDEIGAENHWPWGLSVGDLNADGYEDVFIASSMNFSFRYGLNTVLLNNQGEGFLDSEFILGVEPRPDGETAVFWFVLHCDDDKDRNHQGCQGQEGTIEAWAARGSRSSVIFDIDNDGDLDIVTNEFNDAPMILISNLTERRQVRFLVVNLVGTTSNRDGLGATVRVWVGTRTYTKVYDGVSGHLSHSLPPLYFGLDDAQAVDQIEVDWPSGRRQVVEGPIEVNSVVEVRER